METFFIRLLNMSISAGWLILAVLLLRIVLRNAPKSIRCALWALVGLRLICPFSIKSVISLIPSVSTVPTDVMYSPKPAIDSGVETINNAVNPALAASMSPDLTASVNPLQLFFAVASVVWLAGVAVMLACCAVSCIRMRRTVRASLRLRDNLWLCDDVKSPFIMGIFNPKIYLPSDITDGQLESVSAHENAHIARHDNWWKPLGFALLTLHWFNPLVWVAYSLLSRDIELACDEAAIRGMTAGERRRYSEALLELSAPRRLVAACPLSFGEVSVKQRIKSVLSYKKPALWIIVSAVVLCIIAAVCFLTDPVTSISSVGGSDSPLDITLSRAANIDSELDEFLSDTIIEHNRDGFYPGAFACEAHEIYDIKSADDLITVYMTEMYSEYDYIFGEVKDVSGCVVPTAITVRKTDEGYSLVEYWEPRDGAYYSDDIKEKFSPLARAAAFSSDYAELNKVCQRKAEEHFAALSGDSSAVGHVHNPAENSASVSGTPLSPDNANYLVSVWNDDVLYAFQNKDAFDLLALLGSLDYSSFCCSCAEEYRVEGKLLPVGMISLADAEKYEAADNYSISLSNYFVRHNDAQAELTADQAAKIRGILERQTEYDPNCPPVWN